jgi:hypothetical protein
MNQVLKKTLLIFSISLTLNAQESVYLKRGSSAPFDGFLLPPAKVEELKNATLERDSYKLLNISYEKSLQYQNGIQSALEQQTKLLGEDNTRLATSLRDERSMTTLERIGWFALGVFGTGLAAYGISKATK